MKKTDPNERALGCFVSIFLAIAFPVAGVVALLHDCPRFALLLFAAMFVPMVRELMLAFDKQKPSWRNPWNDIIENLAEDDDNDGDGNK